MHSDRAELIGVSALLFLAGDMQRLARFLTMTGSARRSYGRSRVRRVCWPRCSTT